MFVDWLTTENEATLICDGSGRAAEPIERTVAIAIIQEIVEGFARLSHFGATESGEPCWMADAANRAASAMSAIDSQLQCLSVLDGPACGLRDRSPAPPTGTSGFPISSLIECATRLGRTLRALLELCWYDPSAIEGFCPAEMTWIALHRATHFLEDARLLGEGGGAVADRRTNDEKVEES